jgi:hypothetical protein
MGVGKNILGRHWKMPTKCYKMPKVNAMSTTLPIMLEMYFFSEVIELVIYRTENFEWKAKFTLYSDSSSWHILTLMLLRFSVLLLKITYQWHPYIRCLTRSVPLKLTNVKLAWAFIRQCYWEKWLFKRLATFEIWVESFSMRIKGFENLAKISISFNFNFLHRWRCGIISFVFFPLQLFWA